MAQFPLFPVATTNVFPMANSANGGQLATEFNMRSRESVATPSTIQYSVGPTYVHSERDFAVSLAAGSTSVLTISAGRAVINGHYVELLADVTVDVGAAIAASGESLFGDLAIGIKMMYADSALSGTEMTNNAYAGTLIPEDVQYQVYKGLQVVIVKAADFKLPVDVPASEASVTAHLKLATFRYVNGAVSNIENLAFKNQGTVLDASRIGNVDDLLEGKFISNEGLQPNQFYTFAGKPVVNDQGQIVASGSDTWCKSTDSLMVWDKNPLLGTQAEVDQYSEFGSVDNAAFLWSSEGHLDLVIPHKQIDGGALQAEDLNVRYKYYPRTLTLPNADFSDLNSHGIVTPQYTSAIQEAFNDIETRYFTLFGDQHEQRAYIPKLWSVDELPNNVLWNMYDYVLVGQDYTQIAESNSAQSPATIYQVVPNPITITSLDQLEGPNAGAPATGTKIATVSIPYSTSQVEYVNLYKADVDAQLAELASQGVAGDYVQVNFTTAPTGSYYWAISDNLTGATRKYSDAIWLTFQIQMATEETIGGFLNVSETDTGSGYVYMDAQGHLRVLDYEMLASGALAYQLGQDVEYLNLTVDEIQNQLDAHVNQRVAFPNVTQLYNAYQSTQGGDSVDPSVINITIQLPDDTGATEPNLVTIRDIDSRFGTSVYLHIMGSATSNTTVSVKNCQRLRIDNVIGGNPNLILENCELYYDAAIMNAALSISELSLWYEIDHTQYDSVAQEAAAPQIYVDGLTVYQRNTALVAEDIDAFDPNSPNDLHYAVGLDSITFDQYGDVVGCGIRIQDTITSNNSTAPSLVVASFDFKQGDALIYPYKRMTKRVKVSGEFMTAYPVTDEDCTHHLHTNTFTLITTPYDPDSISMANSQKVPCTLSIRTTVDNVTPIVYSYGDIVSPAGLVINGIDDNRTYVFEGKAIT